MLMTSSSGVAITVPWYRRFTSSARFTFGSALVYFILMLRWLTIEKFSAESGYTADAIRSKIKRGDWLEGQVFVKAPDGRILVSTEGYEAWVISQVSE